MIWIGVSIYLIMYLLTVSLCKSAAWADDNMPKPEDMN